MLLEGIGLKFTVAHTRVEEEGRLQLSLLRSRKPAEIAVAIACRKAEAASRGLKGRAVVIAADTIVVAGKRIVGKPSDEEHAKRILRLLSGKTHHVITGVCLLRMPGHTVHRFSVDTRVTMLKMRKNDRERYVSTGEPMDKAGAYGIQGLGGLLVSRIDGSYTNVVGLPLTELFEGLRKMEAVTW